MSAFDCYAAVPYAQCYTAAAGINTLSLGTTVHLTNANVSGYSTTDGYIPLVITGIAPSCVTATLVTDAAVTGTTGGDQQVYASVYIKKASSSGAPPNAWKQDIQYTARNIAGATAQQFAAGTTQVTVDLLPGAYKVYGDLTVGNTPISGVTADVDARLNVVANRMQ